MPSHVPATNIVRYWSPPNDNFVKINVDGAVNLLIGFRAAYKGLHGMFSPKATELYATIMRLLIASQMGHRSIILEMDTKEIIMNLQTYEQSWSVEGALVNEVRGLFNRFDHISCYLLLRSVTKLLIYWLSRRSCLRTFKCG
ncbi:hypothetical protein L3X38_038207 [Prunus dulcis]|uniref:RNase H type-1 domain-containing protein n=1 Tax=Prunus dulcis TaxID=3755 RepID=A0AAD4V616_PRUDU|nr:hypothetical protein L3X38_038207 [Prunus dulcis]